MSRFGFSKSVKNPSGSWNYEQLIGAKVKVVSTSVNNMFRCFDSSNTLTIKEILFRISTDGKVIPVVILSEIPDKAFIWKDLVVLEVRNEFKYDAICGGFSSGQCVVGYNVDKEATVDPDSPDLNGISLIDDKGNIISNRYIHLVGADVEDPNTDTDNITNISLGLSGDVLD